MITGALPVCFYLCTSTVATNKFTPGNRLGLHRSVTCFRGTYCSHLVVDYYTLPVNAFLHIVEGKSVEIVDGYDNAWMDEKVHNIL